MWILLLFLLAVCVFVFPVCRIAFFHPFKVLYYAIRDPFLYLYHKKYNWYEAGKINAYFAHFGGGKTLSMVQYVFCIYHRYHNKKVWDRKKKAFVVQKILVLSNVELAGVPFQRLEKLSQIVDCAYHNKSIDEEKNIRTVVLVIIDEASSQLNSRSWKDNFSWDFLNTLVTSRHFHMSCLWSAQKFKMCDALMRGVTQQAIWCKKLWRFMVQYSYSADELEMASDPRLIKPLRSGGFFITDKIFSLYDTLATVDKLKKTIEDGDYMTAEEILAQRGDLSVDNNNIIRPSRLLKKIRRVSK